MNPYLNNTPPASNEFETSPNIVPGEIEVAQQIPRYSEQTSAGKFQKFAITFAVFTLVIGSWGYLRQDQLKEFLSDDKPVEPKLASCSLAEGERSCCAQEVECCPSGQKSQEVVEQNLLQEISAESADPSCCEQGKRTAMAAALLQKKTVEEPVSQAAKADISLELALKPIAISDNAPQEPVVELLTIPSKD